MPEKPDNETPAQTTRNFVPIEESFFRFQAEGDSVEGKLVESGPMKIRNNDAMRYKLRQDDGTVVAFHGATEMDGKMSEVEDGQYVRITRRGERPTSGGFNVTQYDVEVAQ